MNKDKTQVHWRKHCALNRIATKCSIFLYTQGKCNGCGHNKKKTKDK